MQKLLKLSLTPQLKMHRTQPAGHCLQNCLPRSHLTEKENRQHKKMTSVSVAWAAWYVCCLLCEILPCEFHGVLVYLQLTSIGYGSLLELELPLFVLQQPLDFSDIRGRWDLDLRTTDEFLKGFLFACGNHWPHQFYSVCYSHLMNMSVISEEFQNHELWYWNYRAGKEGNTDKHQMNLDNMLHTYQEPQGYLESMATH